MARKGIHLRIFFLKFWIVSEKYAWRKIAETFTNAEGCHVLAKKNIGATAIARRLRADDLFERAQE